MYVYVPSASLVPEEARNTAAEFLETESLDSYEPQCGCGE